MTLANNGLTIQDRGLGAKRFPMPVTAGASWYWAQDRRHTESRPSNSEWEALRALYPTLSLEELRSSLRIRKS